MDFTFSAYKRLLTTLIEKGYQITDYHQYSRMDRPIILRHDVDMSIEKALGIAQIENTMDIKSTYFLLLSTEFYNVASWNSLEKVNEIANLGHEIGLHFDEAKYSDERECVDIIPHVYNEARIMEEITGLSIRAVSMHRPSNKTLELDLEFDGIVNSYSRTFFHDFKYLSDSRRRWRENIFDVMASGQYDRLHILTHPFWYNEEELTMKESISQFVNKANYERYLSVRENIRNIDEIMVESEVVG